MRSTKQRTYPYDLTPAVVKRDPEIRGAIELYITWLNKWNHASGMTDSDYTIESFTKRWSPPNPYLSDVLYDSHEHNDLQRERVLHLRLNDGDEGGPSDLIVYAYDGAIKHMTQIFDTLSQTIYAPIRGDRNERSQFEALP